MLDLLPTSATVTGFFVWSAVLVIAVGVTFATIGISERVENEIGGWVAFVAPVSLVGLSVLNLRLLIRARDIFWNDTWVSVFLLIIVVLIIGVLAVLEVSRALDDAELTVLAVWAAAAVSAVGSVLWGISHVIDAIARALPPLGVIAVIVVAGFLLAKGSD